MSKRQYGFWLAFGSIALVLLGGCQSLANITGKNAEHNEKRVQKSDDNVSHLLRNEEVVTTSRRAEGREVRGGEDAGAALVVEQPLQQQLRIYRERDERLREQIAHTRHKLRELQATLRADENSLKKNEENIRITQNVMDAIRRGQIETLAATNTVATPRGEPDPVLTPTHGVGVEEFSSSAPPPSWTLDNENPLPRNAARLPRDILGGGDRPPVYESELNRAPDFMKAPVQPRQAGVGEAWDTSLAFGVDADKPDALILTAEGEGSDAMGMISIGGRDGVQKGMLYETTDTGGERVVLYVTEVFPTYSRVQPHLRHPPKGGLVKGGGLTRLFNLPN